MQDSAGQIQRRWPARHFSRSLRRTIEADRDAVEAMLEKISGRFDGTAGRVAAHILRAGGKRLRPLVSCAVMRSLGKDPMEHAERIACVEVIHAASLLHDDVVDGAGARRGRVAAHLQYGTRTAVMAGDALMAEALEILAATRSDALQRQAAHAVATMARGQIMESEHSYQTDVPLEELLAVNRMKTASLFSYAAESGAILARCGPPIRHAAALFGDRIGEAFQLVDDLLDWTGRKDVTGKTPGRDLREGKTTVPLLLAMRADPVIEEEVRRYWADLRHDGNAPPEVSSADLESRGRSLIWRVSASGALDETRTRARRMAMEAAEALEPIPQTPWRDELMRLASRSVDRAA